MKYSYYPGCSLHSTAREFDMSFREVCAISGIKLEEIRDWTCCGASSAHPVSHLLSVALPAANLARAEAGGHSEVLVPCAACFLRLKAAAHEIENNAEVKFRMNQILSRPFYNSVRVTHPLELMDGLIKKGVYGGKQARDMSGLKIACYYGCLLMRPPKITQFDNCEYPMTMDRILRSFGIQTLDWSYKTECCGGAFGVAKPELTRKLVKKILDNAVAVGADALAVACPMCHANLDSRQADLNSAGGNYNIPVFYFTQLMGLAMGVPSEKLGLKSHMVGTGPLLAALK